MATKEQFVKRATSYMGYNYKHFCDSFWGGCWAWCAAFVATVGKESGVDVPWSTSCTAQVNEWKKRGLYHTDRNIQVGDVVYYNWDDIYDPDHVGICTAVASDGKLTITEGNFGNLPNGQTKVENRYIYPSYKYIFGYARPVFDKSTTEAKPSTPVATSDKEISVTTKQVKKGSTGPAVKALQAILQANDISLGKYGCDGEFGNDTDTAVKEFQRKKGLTVDGIAGPNTWNALLK